MAKKMYIGVDGKARKVKKMYIGVDGKARKVKKAYIGVNGVARCIYKSDIGQLGTSTLSQTGPMYASFNVGNYAVFPSVTATSSGTYTLNAFNPSLTRTTASGALIDPVSTATIGNTLAIGGFTGSTNPSFYSYNSNLVQGTGISIDYKVYEGASSQNYALFLTATQSDISSGYNYKNLTALTTNLTKTTTTNINSNKSYQVIDTEMNPGVSIGNSTFFHILYNATDGYKMLLLINNNTLTKTNDIIYRNIVNASTGKFDSGTCRIASHPSRVLIYGSGSRSQAYAMGNYFTQYTLESTVYQITADGTVSTSISLSSPHAYGAYASNSDGTIIAGGATALDGDNGRPSTHTNIAEFIDKTLTRSTLPNLSIASSRCRGAMAGSSVFVFAGGTTTSNDGTYCNNVTAYE